MLSTIQLPCMLSLALVGLPLPRCVKLEWELCSASQETLVHDRLGRSERKLTSALPVYCSCKTGTGLGLPRTTEEMLGMYAGNASRRRAGVFPTPRDAPRRAVAAAKKDGLHSTPNGQISPYLLPLSSISSVTRLPAPFDSAFPKSSPHSMCPSVCKGRLMVMKNAPGI